MYFDDSLSGGYSELVSAVNPAPNAGIWHTMNYPGYLNYTSAVPHLDSAKLNLNITQTAGVPWFAGAGGLAQVNNTAGNTAMLTVQYASYFEGSMVGTPIIPALSLMAYNVSGIVGTHAGSFVSFQAQIDYFDNNNIFIASIGWNYSNTTPGAFTTTVLPTFMAGSPFLTDNLVTAQGYFQLQADPSSINVAPVIPTPEPSALALLGVGCAGIMCTRNRKK